MRTILLPVFLLTTCWLLFAGCYKDKGNYQYHDINNINTGIPDTTLTVFQFDTLHLKADIRQSIPGAAGLSYEWVMYPVVTAPLTRRTLSISASVDALITEGPGAYVLNLFVTDNATSITTTKKINVKVVSALNEGWLVLENGNTNADVSIITPVDSVFHHIYSKANPEKPLPAGTHHLAVTNRRGEQNIYLLSPAGGTQVGYSTFKAITDFKDWFFVAPATAKPQLYMSFSGGEVMLNNGQPYGLSLMVPAPYKFSLAPVGNYYMAPFAMPSVYGPVFYDTISQRFMSQDSYTFDLFTFANADSSAAFNLNNVGKRLLYAENGPGQSQTYCVFKNNHNDSLFVYTIANNGSYSDPGIAAPVGKAPGMATAAQFQVSKQLPHIYYAAGNTIYLYDVPAATARAVYTFPAGTTVSCMRIPKENTNVLTVATSETGEGKVYYFPIAPTGDFEHQRYSKVFGGFGSIKDICYKYAP